MSVFGIGNKRKEEGVSPAILEAVDFKYEDISNEVRVTRKQFEALHTALKHEYYSWPRKVTLEDMAQRSDTTRRAFQENLRKAEAKILPHIVRKFMRGE